MNKSELEKKNKLFNDLLRRTAAKRDFSSYTQHYELLRKMMQNCEEKMTNLGGTFVVDDDIKQLQAEIQSRAKDEEPEIQCFRNYFVAGSEGSQDRCDGIIADFQRDCLNKLLSLEVHVIDIQILQNLVRVKSISDGVIFEFSCHGLPSSYSYTGKEYREMMGCCVQAIGYIKGNNVLECLTEYYKRNDFNAIKLQLASEIFWNGEDNVIKGYVEKNDIRFTLKLRYDVNHSQCSDICAQVITETQKYDFDNMNGHDFEFFCAKLLEKNGFNAVSVTRGSGDQGIDIIAYRDGVKYGFQCKCYSSPIGNRAVQEVFAGKTFYQCHVGVVLTNSYFTKAAIDLAKHNGVILWDRDKLLGMIEDL